MTVNTALEQLLEIEDRRQEGAYGRDTLAVGISRLGAPDQQIVAGGMAELLDVDFGPPLHCLIIAGTVHVVEEEILGYYRIGAPGAAGGAAAAGEGGSTAAALAVEKSS
jgi:diphthine synthase